MKVIVRWFNPILTRLQSLQKPPQQFETVHKSAGALQQESLQQKSLQHGNLQSGQQCDQCNYFWPINSKLAD